MIQHEGPGWRLVRDPSRHAFPVLIGGDGWSVELTQFEWEAFFALIRDLTDQHQQLENQLMPQETLSIEIEREPWWASLDGDRKQWSLQVILCGTSTNHRGVEAYWPSPAAQAMALAVRTMWDSH